MRTLPPFLCQCSVLRVFKAKATQIRRKSKQTLESPRIEPGTSRSCLYKSAGNKLLTWSELQDVLLDVEVALNNRPLSYVEDDVQLPVLTPNALLFGRPNQLPEEDYQNLDEHELRRQARYLRRCKDLLWGRWTSEYLKGATRKAQHET